MNEDGCNTRMPLVSIVIPTHNRAGLLERAVRSAVNQTYPSIEVIVVDDCSTDHTREAVEAWQKDCDRIRYVRLDAPSGANAARNRGIREARGEFIVGLDDDDQFDRRRVELLMKHYDDRYAFACSGFYVRSGRRRKRVNCRDAVIGPEGLRIITSIVGNSVLARRGRFLEVGGYDESLGAAQDTDMWLRLIDRFGSGKRIGKPLYTVYTGHSGRTTNSERKFRGYFSFYLKHKSSLSGRERRYLLYKLKALRVGRIRFRDYCRYVPVGRKWAEMKNLIKQLLRRSS